jgi:NAD(P)-dependent dehydrogenase (short-subunit alcohol dehydrogenase family)
MPVGASSEPGMNRVAYQQSQKGCIMTERLAGKVAVVTGGTSGIGLATAHRFAAEGATVFLTGRREAELAAAVEQVGRRAVGAQGECRAVGAQGECRAVGIQGDVAKLEDLDRLYATVRERAGRVDVLFANAGIAEFATIEQITEAGFDQTFAVDVKGVLFTVQKALSLMPDGAAVVLNASMLTIKGVPAFGLLSAAKAAVRSFARTWANELKDRRIRVNAVSPGPVETPAVGNLAGGQEQGQKLLSEMAVHVPLGRVAQPDEIAKAVLFLASDDASYVNGVELFVDGGMVQV